MSTKNVNWHKWLTVIFFCAVVWEIFIFVRLPKQAFMQGLLESWLVGKGLFFYKDFFGGYLPFLRTLMVPLHAVFGYSQYTTIALAPITTIAVLYLLLQASRKWMSNWYSLLPIASFTLWHTFLSNNHFLATSFLGLSVLASVILWLSWWDKPTVKKSIIIGFLTAASIFTLQIVLPFFAILNLSFVLRFEKKRIKKAFQHLIYSFVGFLIPALVIGLWFLSKGALDDLYLGAVKYFFTSYPYSNLGKETQNVLIYLSIHLPIFLFFITNIKDKKKISLLLMFICLPLTFWFAIFHPIRFEISLPSFALIFGFAVQDLYSVKSIGIRKAGILLLTLILGINIFTIGKYKFTEYKEKLFETRYSYQILSEVYPNDPMYAAIEWMRANSNKEDKLFVLADALFYLKTDRLLANWRALASEPFVYTPFEEFKSEIENSRPDFWVIDERQWKRFDDFGYHDLSIMFQELVNQDPVVAKFEYITIRRHSEEVTQ